MSPNSLQQNNTSGFLAANRNSSDYANYPSDILSNKTASGSASANSPTTPLESVSCELAAQIEKSHALMNEMEARLRPVISSDLTSNTARDEKRDEESRSRRVHGSSSAVMAFNESVAGVMQFNERVKKLLQTLEV